MSTAPSFSAAAAATAGAAQLGVRRSARCFLAPPTSVAPPRARCSACFLPKRPTALRGAASAVRAARRRRLSQPVGLERGGANHREKRHASPRALEAQPRARGTFDWLNQWYPVSLEADLHTKRPNALQVLGTDIVVWRARRSDDWTVFRDRCPHRFAALSEGRINRATARLECGYHGWQFNSKGECSLIPQSEKPPSDLLCATSLPSTVRSGMLFVWMGSCQPPADSFPSFIDDVRAKYITSSYSRVLPLCFTTLIQNVLDPAHIHFAHHGQIGRRDLAAPIPVRILKHHTIEGFTADYYGGSVRLRYRPPCLVEIVTADGLSFAYYAVPISSGLVRTFALRGTSRRPLFRIPSWLDHIQRNRLVEADLQLMISQQREMRKSSTTTDYVSSWRKFNMPTTSDRLIVEMSKWLVDHAPPEACHWFTFHGDDNCDRYKSRLTGHTAVCASCSRLRRSLQHAERIAFVIALGATIGGLPAHDKTRAVSYAVVTVSVVFYIVSYGLRKRLE